MLKVDKISTGYGKKQVLYDVSFEVNKGEIVLLTGGNGSGKSTVLKAVYGLLPLWSGSIAYWDEDLTQLSTLNMLSKGIVYIPQKNNYFENLTIKENLQVAGSIYPKRLLTQRMERVWKLPKLYKFRNRTPFNLSGGERQLLAFGCALLHEPIIVLFDEPYAGLDNKSYRIISDEILKHRDELKTAFLIIEHTKVISSYANKSLTIELGKLSA